MTKLSKGRSRASFYVLPGLLALALTVVYLGVAGSPTSQASSPTAAPSASRPRVQTGCPLFPPDNIWNTPIDILPGSSAYISAIGADKALKADFGSGLYQGAPIGIPFISVPQNQTRYSATFDVPDESDPGPYAIPLDAPIEGGSTSDGDRHVLAVTQGECKLYELYYSFPQANSWQAYSGAIFDLNSNNLRPAGWTSADAAGLPIVPGLVNYDEVAAGSINHALRFTVSCTSGGYVWPARHHTSPCAGMPPMGQRFRLKASFDISGFSHDNQVILTALKKYGMMVADNGSDWFISGAPDERWSNDDLALLRNITGSNFESVDVSPLQLSPDSGQVAPPATPSNLTATALSTSQIRVTWQDHSNYESAVYLERKTGAGTFARIANLPPNTTTYTDSGLTDGTSYTYRVQEATGAALSAYSNQASATTPPFANHLAFNSLPTSAEPGYAFTVQPHVQVIDINGQLDTQYNGTITLALKPGTGDPTATLGGNLTATVVNGVATFSGLSISKIGPGYQLTATASGKPISQPTLNSAAFNVVGKLVFLDQPPSSTLARGTFNGLLRVQVQRPSDNSPVNNYAGSIKLGLAAPTSAVLSLNNSGTPIVRAANGVTGTVSFNQELTVDRLAGGLRLEAAPAGTDPLTIADSVPFDSTGLLSVSAPAPANPVANASFGLTVTVQGAGGITLTNYAGLVHLNLTNNPTSAYFYGNPSASASGGVAVFNNLALSNPGTGYTISATVGNLAQGNVSFDVGTPSSCDGLLVNSASDAANADTFPDCTTITLRGALSRATGGQIVRLDRNVFGTSAILITLTSALPTLTNVGIDAGCLAGGPGLNLSSGGTAMLFQLGPNSSLRGVKFIGPVNGLRLKIAGTPNTLTCTKVGP